MKTAYILALAPVKGGESPFRKYSTMSPLANIIPWGMFKVSFPRDRISKEKIKGLPSVELTGPESSDSYEILKWSNADSFFPLSQFIQGIHNKEAPKEDNHSFIDWKGMMLSPLPVADGLDVWPELEERIILKKWQIELHKVRWNEERLWWQDLSLKRLWYVRKPVL